MKPKHDEFYSKQRSARTKAKPYSIISEGVVRKSPRSSRFNSIQIRRRVVPQQWRILLDYMEARPELVQVYPGNRKLSKTELNQYWEEAATQLNRVGSTKKTTEKWKSAVCDWKYKTKFKVMQILRHSSSGDKNIHELLEKGLTDNEKRLAIICGWDRNLSLVEAEDVESIKIENNSSGDDSSCDPFREEAQIPLNMIDVKSEIDPLINFDNRTDNSSQNSNVPPRIISSPPPLHPLTSLSPPPLILLETKNKTPKGSGDSDNDKAKTKKMGKHRKSSNSACSKEVIEVLGTIASGIQGILGELKVISGTIQRIIEK